MSQLVPRCAGLLSLILVALAFPAAADDGGPVPGPIYGMKCAPSGACGGQTQVDNCHLKAQGASCSFCSGSNELRMCRPTDTSCNHTGNEGCGTTYSGSCQMVSNKLICTGNVGGGDCTVPGCS